MTLPKTTIDVVIHCCHANGQIQVRQSQRNQRLLWGIGDTDDHPVSRAVVEEFYNAYVSRDAQRIGATLDDDVEWHVAGPAEVMQVCGFWRGKAAVIDRFTHLVPKIVHSKAWISSLCWSTAT